MIPEWVMKYKVPGTTIKQIGHNYYLYSATSHRHPDKSYPVSAQTYIGKITADGVVSERVSINVGKTEARRLSELIAGLPPELGDIIVLNIKKDWLYTKTDVKLIKALEERGIYCNGKVVF